MEKFTISYKITWGMPSGGKEVKYNSDTKELFARPGATRLLTSDEETDLKKQILDTGYLDSNQDPKDDPNATTEGTSTNLAVTIGNKSRSVEWYYGVGENPIVPIEIQKVEEIINKIAFPK
jgi:hypothetical protein